ncbi:MAG: hypothetical protein ACX932_00450 [Gammaproteobacteria bacterium]
MGEQLAGGFNKVGRQQLTVEQFDVLDRNNAITVQQHLAVSDPLLKNALCANVAVEQVKQYARDEQKRASAIAQRVENAQKLIESEKEKAEANQDVQLSQLLIREDKKLEKAHAMMNHMNKELSDANREAATVANDVQGLVALLRKSQRAFEKGVDNYVKTELSHAKITLKDGRELNINLSSKAAKDLARYLKDNTSVDEMMEKPAIKSMIHHAAEQLKQQYREQGESEAAIAEKNVVAQVRADFRKQELTKQLSRKQIVVVGALRNALEEQHPEVLNDGSITKQLTSFANSDEFMQTCVDSMMAQYATELELAHASRLSDVIMDKAVRSEAVINELKTLLTGTTHAVSTAKIQSEKEEPVADNASKPLSPSSR